jgi:S-DNA-T family DNA segregation ATPase FtsK/SpoIIIE
VCINAIIISILMHARPEEIRLLMIDPKKVELASYSRLPHMIAPVITQPKEACLALNWLVREMDKRYEIFRRVGVRNITAFNQRKRDQKFEESLEIEIPEKMAYFVAIIDELADLMMVAQNDIETPITRIAQMARAVGIHLILATQRPSREVITGLIKANFPVRIAFKVSNRINSQIILDETGAEALLGMGDMLFLPPGTGYPIRAQGAFVKDEEINQVVDYICSKSHPSYLIEHFESVEESLLPEELAAYGSGEQDSLYTSALQLVTQMEIASTTFLQRKLQIGYARAAKIMDQLEANGVIGPAEGAKPRRILLSPGHSIDPSTLMAQEE